MNNTAIGTSHRIEKIVNQEDSARAYGSGLVDVFATPAMVALMEKTSLQLVAPFLDSGENTVGIHIDINHIKATPIGQRVRCEATLVAIDGKKLVFKVLAHDEQALIGEGTHTRYVIDEAKFLARL